MAITENQLGEDQRSFDIRWYLRSRSWRRWTEGEEPLSPPSIAAFAARRVQGPCHILNWLAYFPAFPYFSFHRGIFIRCEVWDGSMYFMGPWCPLSYGANLFRGCCNKTPEDLDPDSGWQRLGGSTLFSRRGTAATLEGRGRYGASSPEPTGPQNFPSWFCLARLKPALSFKSLFKPVREQVRNRHIRFKYHITDRLQKQKVFTPLQWTGLPSSVSISLLPWG